VPDFLISSGHEQEKDIAANLQHRMFLMTATVLLTAALLRGLIASIAPVAGQAGRGVAGRDDDRGAHENPPWRVRTAVRGGCRN